MRPNRIRRNLAVRAGLRLRVRRTKLMRSMYRGLRAVSDERRMITLYECRKLTRERIWQRAVRKKEVDEQADRLWGDEEEEDLDKHGGSSWVNALHCLTKETI